MLHGIILLWYILTIPSVIFLLWDQFTNTPSTRIMTLAWFLVLLYTGPIGLFFYFMTCRQPMPNTHADFIKPFWKQAFGSELHCVAGDATGIIISAIVLSFFALPNGIETLIEYGFAYIFGLLLFQALFMLPMYKNYGKAVNKTIFPETVSMNFVMTGMLPTVVILRHFWPNGNYPSSPEFWFIMSIATLVGLLFGFPINAYLVKKGEKNGMMSKKQPQAMKPDSHMQMQGMMSHNQASPMKMNMKGKLSAPTKIAWALGSYVLIVGVFVIIQFFVPFKF